MEKLSRAKSGDLILNLLYQVYDSGRNGEEEGFGSFIENVSLRILSLLDNGVLKRGLTYSSKEFNKYTKGIERPVSTPSWSITPQEDKRV